jgi:hypothetical protein
MATCPKCKRQYSKEVQKTRHHTLPKRWFPNQKKPEILHICRSPCHDDLERVILAEEQGRQLRWFRYYEIINEFLGYPFYNVETL